MKGENGLQGPRRADQSGTAGCRGDSVRSRGSRGLDLLIDLIDDRQQVATVQGVQG